MKKIIVIALLAVCIVGCEKMSRQEVITAVKECTDADLEPVILHNGLTLDPVKVNCELPKMKEAP